ncbi:hypothetical protein GCM10020229_60450 [Kitasatospora albolonga]
MDPAGAPVTGPDGRPVTTTTDADGAYGLRRPGARELPGPAVVPPEGYRALRADTERDRRPGRVPAPTSRSPVAPSSSTAPPPVRTGDDQPVVIRLPKALCGGEHLSVRPPRRSTAPSRSWTTGRIALHPRDRLHRPGRLRLTPATTATGTPRLVTGEEHLTVYARPQLADSGRPTGPLLAASRPAWALGAAAPGTPRDACAGGPPDGP